MLSFVLTSKINRIKKNYKSVGTNLNSLGVAHAKRLSYRKAMKCFSDSLLARKTTLGKRHPDVAETLHNMVRDIDIIKQ